MHGRSAEIESQLRAVSKSDTDLKWDATSGLSSPKKFAMAFLEHIPRSATSNWPLLCSGGL
ncbi:MAG: hypothetical protein L0Y44_14480, partial [Phycisphaerales bacterium]|nr:hypothetical protein [Phycisphaerales bacterium]MCI0631850.1 hypothetical protein [Phycisphaerales bacterium]